MAVTRLAVLVIFLASSPASADKKCQVEKPVVAKARAVKAPPCNRPTAAIAKSITDEIKTEYHPERSGKPEVTFPCDGLGPKIHEIVIETGAGHGGSLELWRAKRRSDGKYDARGIIYRGSSMTHTAAAIPHQQASAIVELPELAKARAAATAKVREVVEARRGRGETYSMSSSFSSRDFHIVLRFVDDEGRVLERRYTGYESSSHQDTYLGLEIAERALSPITALEPDPNLAADQDDRNFFAASFNAAVPHFDDQYVWWVMERYVDLARFLGGPSVVAGLLTRLTITKPDRSKIDARADAVDALAKITGWDPRKDGKSVEEAAAALLAECR